ncbi:hypothetical protein AVEN_38950-1 [Araneus ventricosus]|uniref:Uncharacterized protein n=1 Tax=Araneus ventricosus TaxID=182803 RepID=A0A4Y2S132_ARAVE|nr:hypothetical protein AVEN_38950-1 [Araneus ventricosus]
MTAGIVRIVRKLPSSPNTSGRATRTKKARIAGMKSNTFVSTYWPISKYTPNLVGLDPAVSPVERLEGFLRDVRRITDSLQAYEYYHVKKA